MPGETARELRHLVEAYDRCWLEGRPQDLRQFLHPDVVFTGPRFQRLAVAAVITYCWMVDYEMDRKRYSEIGRELLVLVRRAGRWLVAWRTQYSEPAPAAS